MNHSDPLTELAPALVAAQKALRNPHVDSKAKVQTKTGGSYEYKYLSLPALLETVRDAFREHGLAVLQEVSEAPRGIGVTTRIIHTSGQWLDSGPLVLPAGGAAQEHGSAITYARRYSLAAAVGLAADEDDDASAAQRAASSTPPKEAAKTGSGRPSGHPSPAGGTAPEPVESSTGGAAGLAGEGVQGGSSGGLIHAGKCGGTFVADKSREGWLVCDRCTVYKKAAA